MIEIRRNLSINASFTCENPDGLRKLFPEQSEEQKAMTVAFNRQKKLAEEQIWLQIEFLETPLRDPLGQAVTRHTHEICWEPTGAGHKRPDGSVVYEMRPYIQPVKSEYEK